HIHFYFSQTSFVCYFGCIFGSQLSSIRSVFLRSSEAHFTCRRPGDHIAFFVGQRDYYVVERSSNMCFPNRLNINFTFFLSNFSFCHLTYYLVAFFLLATVFLLPFLVLELFLVLCPLKGNPDL